MPRLKDLLEYLATPGLEDVWILLDVKLLLPTLAEVLTRNKAVQTKLDNYADDLFRSIAMTLADVKPAPSRPWNQRVLVGCWAVSLILLYRALPMVGSKILILSSFVFVLYRQSTSLSARNICQNIQ